jgi:CRP/FNR family cyclic AMP-dependent transcriptional regulator
MDANISRAAVAAGFPATLIAAVLDDYTVQRVRAHEILISRGIPNSDVFFVVSGRFEVKLAARDGQEIIVRSIGGGDLLGEFALLSGEQRSATVVAVRDSIVLRVPGTHFLAALESNAADALWIMRRLAGQLVEMTDKLFEIGTLAVRVRIHCELLRQCSAAGVTDNRALLSPAPTHGSLAQRVGTQREAVTREISWLKRSGIIESGQGWLQIVDHGRLLDIVERELGEPFRKARRSRSGQPAAVLFEGAK